MKTLFFLNIFIWLTISVSAQNQPASDPLAQAKLDIWTETASFVYRDANMAEPENIGNATSLNEFVDAIKKEDSKSHIFSKVYKPIEETGTYKKGANAKAQLDLLIKSINMKLRENEQRMRDINRRQRLSDLNKQLTQIATDYVNPTAANQTGVVPTEDTINGAAGTGLATFPGNATDTDTIGEEYAENQLSSLSKRKNENLTTNNNWMSIAALILGIINLGLFYFLFQGINKLNARMDQRKKDFDLLSQQLQSGGGRAGNSGKPDMAAIESLVQKTVAQELAKIGPSRPIVHAQKAEPKPAPLPVREEPLVSTPAPAEEALLATPEPAEIPPAPAPAPENKPQSLFARVPVNGGFHEQDLYTTQQHDSIYEIRVSKKDPSKAAFRIVTNTSVHRTAIESAYLSLKDACNYQLNNQHATRIVTDEPGLLNIQDGFWQIEKKAQVHFE